MNQIYYLGFIPVIVFLLSAIIFGTWNGSERKAFLLFGFILISLLWAISGLMGGAR